MRHAGVDAESPHLVGLVILEVALEPLEVALALEGETLASEWIAEKVCPL